MISKPGLDRYGLMVGLAAVVLALAGCAGKAFVRAKPDAFVLGKTMRAQVYARVGPHPRSFGVHEEHGRMVRSMTYRYENNFMKGLRPEISPVEAQTFYFVKNVLVGMDYTNSFKGHGTEFDVHKIGDIKIGKSTRADVVQLLGPASGRYAPPMIPGSGYRALVYYSKQISGDKLLANDKLIVSYNRKGIVTGVKYTHSGSE